MNFDQQKAAELASRYQLPPATVRTWKARGKIPDRYFVAGFLPSSGKKYKFFAKMIENKEFINFNYLSKILKIPRLRDAALDRSTLNREEVKILKKYFFSLLKKKASELLFERSLHLCKILTCNTLTNFRAKLKRGTLSEEDEIKIFNAVKKIFL